jgi:hypothetical protein
MARKYLHIIERTDDDDLVVEGDYINTGVGLQYSAGGVTTTVPWGQVTRVRRVDVEDLRRLDEAEDADDVDVSDEVRDVYDQLRTGPAGEDYELPAPELAPGADGTIEAPDPADDPNFVPTHDHPAPGVTRAGAGQEQVGEDQGPGETGAGQARETGGQPTNKQIRDWAKETGLDVPASGPVPDKVREAYASAHTD